MATEVEPKELELTVRSTSKITDDDYFKDIDFEISEQDRAKAGYKIPKKTISPEEFLQRNKIESFGAVDKNHHYVTDGNNLIMGPPKPMGEKTLRGDLTNQPVPLPMNYFDGPSLFDATSHVSQKLEPGSQKLEPGSITKMNVGGDDILVAKGPNNQSGNEGFAVGIFNAGKFGSFPSADQAIVYHPDHLIMEDSIKRAKLDAIDPQELNKNPQILSADYGSKTLPDITQTGQSLAEALIEVTEIAIKEPMKEVSADKVDQVEQMADSNLQSEMAEMKLKIEDQNRIIHDLVSSVESLSQSVIHLSQQVETLIKVDRNDHGIFMKLYNKVAWWR